MTKLSTLFEVQSKFGNQKTKENLTRAMKSATNTTKMKGAMARTKWKTIHTADVDGNTSTTTTTLP